MADAQRTLRRKAVGVEASARALTGNFPLQRRMICPGGCLPHGKRVCFGKLRLLVGKTNASKMTNFLFGLMGGPIASYGVGLRLP